MVEYITYRERRFPIRTIYGDYNTCNVSTKELEDTLIEGARNLDGTAIELLESICLFCSEQELRYLTDEELTETIYEQ